MAGTITRAELRDSILDRIETAFGPSTAITLPIWTDTADAIATGILDALTSEIADGDYLRRDGTNLVGDAGAGGGGVTDHGALTGLADDDHPQYATDTDLTSAVAFVLAALAAHGAQHLPGGSDPLTTAAPVAVGLALSAGSANSFARSDHVHTVDSALLNLNPQSGVAYEVDLTSLATQNFADGSLTIDGRTWVCGQRAAANLWGLVNGVGLQWTPTAGGGGTRTFTAATQTAAYLYTTLPDLLGTLYEPSARYRIEVVYSITLNGAEATRMYLGWWRPLNSPIGASAQTRMAAIVTVAGPLPSPGVLPTGTVSNNSNRDLTGRNILGCLVEHDGPCNSYSGLYTGGAWTDITPEYGVQTLISGDVPITHRTARITLSSSMNATASPASAYTITRLRVVRA